jgi:hypothetical protein
MNMKAVRLVSLVVFLFEFVSLANAQVALPDISYSLRSAWQIMQRDTEIRQNLASTTMQSSQEVATRIPSARYDFKLRMRTAQENGAAKLQVLKEQLEGRLAGRGKGALRSSATSVAESIASVNQNQVQSLASITSIQERILLSILSRAQKGKLAGMDVSAVDASIAPAYEAITIARTAIERQASTMYTLDDFSGIEPTAALKMIRASMQSDLASTTETVRNAQRAVRRAAFYLSQIPQIDMLAQAAPAADIKSR